MPITNVRTAADRFTTVTLSEVTGLLAKVVAIALNMPYINTANPDAMAAPKNARPIRLIERGLAMVGDVSEAVGWGEEGAMVTCCGEISLVSQSESRDSTCRG